MTEINLVEQTIEHAKHREFDKQTERSNPDEDLSDRLLAVLAAEIAVASPASEGAPDPTASELNKPPAESEAVGQPPQPDLELSPKPPANSDLHPALKKAILSPDIHT